MYRISLMGRTGVGKRAIVTRFVDQQFVVDYDPTIEHTYRKQCIVDGKGFVLDVEQLSYSRAQEYAIREPVGLRASGVLLVYDITSRSSFEETQTKDYDQILRTKGVSRFPMVLVGNKSDLEAKREVGVVEGENLAKQYGIPSFEVSSLNGNGIEACFHALVREIEKFAKESETKSRSKPLSKKPRCTIM